MLGRGTGLLALPRELQLRILQEATLHASSPLSMLAHLQMACSRIRSLLLAPRILANPQNLQPHKALGGREARLGHADMAQDLFQ